jgi:hypothetical protein
MDWTPDLDCATRGSENSQSKMLAWSRLTASLNRFIAVATAKNKESLWADDALFVRPHQ